MIIFLSLVIYYLQVFGEVDSDLYEGDLLYTPVVKKWYYEVVITDIAVGGESLALDCKKVNSIIFFVRNILNVIFFQNKQL